MAAILTIEDNVETQYLLKQSLEGTHEVYVAYTLESAKEILQKHPIDLIVLDLMLPDGEGISLLKEISTSHSAVPIARIPIIILSSINDTDTIVNGLQLGADDYISKPFIGVELSARIDSVLRRGPVRHKETHQFIGDISVDIEKQSASVMSKGVPVDLCLTPIELKILVNLSRNFGVAMSREVLQDSIWGKTYTSKRNIDSHVCNLRRKLEISEIDVSNKRGEGYYLVKSKDGKSSTSPSVQPEKKSSSEELPVYGINDQGPTSYSSLSLVGQN